MKNKNKTFIAIFFAIVTLFITTNVKAADPWTYSNRCVYSFTDDEGRADQRVLVYFMDNNRAHIENGMVAFQGKGSGNHAADDISFSSAGIVRTNGYYYCPTVAYFCRRTKDKNFDGYMTREGEDKCNEKQLFEMTLTESMGVFRQYVPKSHSKKGGITLCNGNVKDTLDNETTKYDGIKTSVNEATTAKEIKNLKSRIEASINSLKNEINTYCETDGLADLIQKYNDLLITLQSKVNSSDEISDEEKENINSSIDEIKSTITELIKEYNDSTYSIPESNKEYTCSGLLDPELKEIIQLALKWTRIIAPIALILLVSVDFAQVVISNDKDATQKAISKAIKRGIAALVLFFIPLIVSIVINWVDSEYMKKNNVNDCMDILR